MTRCNDRHPMFPRQVRCEDLRGHRGDHFHSFYMRRWQTVFGTGQSRLVEYKQPVGRIVAITG